MTFDVKLKKLKGTQAPNLNSDGTQEESGEQTEMSASETKQPLTRPLVWKIGSWNIFHRQNRSLTEMSW